MQMIYRLLSVLFILSICSVAYASSLRSRVNQNADYFIIRSEWDDRCVAYIAGNLQLEKNCALGEAVWESTAGSKTNVSLKNYFTGKYLAFAPGVKKPLMNDAPVGLAKFTFQVVHQRNRRYPGNQSYWGVIYHVIRNTATGLCLMVDGNIVSQLNCNPGRPEHLSFEHLSFENSVVE